MVRFSKREMCGRVNNLFASKIKKLHKHNETNERMKKKKKKKEEDIYLCMSE